MGLFDFLFGSGDKMNKVETMTPQQQQVLNQVLSQVMQMQGSGGGQNQAMSYLQGLLDPNSEAYKNFEAPYMQQFQDQTLPMLAERFAGAGAQGGALSSSGFGQALGAAGSQLGSNLAGLKSGLQQQSAQGLMGQYNNLLGQGLGAQPFGYQQQQGQPGVLPQALQGLLGGLGGGVANWMNPNFGKQGQGYQAQQPLTNMYANLFQTGALV